MSFFKTFKNCEWQSTEMLLLPSYLHYAKLLNSCVNILMNSEPRPTREAPQRAVTFWSVLIITHQETDELHRIPSSGFGFTHVDPQWNAHLFKYLPIVLYLQHKAKWIQGFMLMNSVSRSPCTCHHPRLRQLCFSYRTQMNLLSL